MWCTNELEVEGSVLDLQAFRLDVCRVEVKGTERVAIPLSFSRLLPRPAGLDDVEESSVGLRGYQALYGDWEELLQVRWIREAGVSDRRSLIRYLEQLDPNHFYLAQRYRANEAKYGFRNWYKWNLQHWGTKWDLDSSTQVEEQPNKLIYRFQTFENPPLPWFEVLRRSYLALKMNMTSRLPWKQAAEADLALNRSL